MSPARSALLLSAAPVLAVAAPAQAGGIPAGTLIENTARASYTIGGGARTLDSNTVTILVDELLDVAVASVDAGTVTVTGSAVLTFTVTNTGNGPETFALTADPAVAGNDFDVQVDSLAIDSNGNGVYDPGVDAVLANGAASPVLAPDTSVTVFVLVTAPNAPDGAQSRVALLAGAATGTGTPGTIFAGAGEGGGSAVVGSTGADDQATGALAARSTEVELVKSATVRDPFGGTSAVPGARITFRIAANATGSGAVNDLVVTDAVPAATTYAPNSLTLDGTPLTDAADADAGTANATGIAVTLGTTAAGTSRTVTFDVIVD